MAESSEANRNHKPGSAPPIFLSHSGKQKPFVEQLFEDLKAAQQDAFFDQDTDSLPIAEKFDSNILDAAEQCEMGVVVLSKEYLTSLWPMLELSKFVESKKTKKPNLQLFPLFFKLLPKHLKDSEVESRWKPAWRKIVPKNGKEEEVLKLWSEAVKTLRSCIGLRYAKFGKSEFKYRAAVVREICKKLPPESEWKMNIQGYERLCKMVWSMFERNESCEYLGLYGMAGAGKSTLCKAICRYSKGEFGPNVFYLDLTSISTLDRLNTLLGQMGVANITLGKVTTVEQGFACLDKVLQKKPQIFLAIDNVGDCESSQEEARLYLSAKLPSNSKVLVTSRSKDILQAILGNSKYCKFIPRLNHLDAMKLFLSIAAPRKSMFNGNAQEIVERCLSKCRFVESGYPIEVYHPIILKAIGGYLNKKDSLEISEWERALESNNILSSNNEEGKNVQKMLGLNYETLSDKMKLVFLDTALYPKRGYEPWWFVLKEGYCDTIWAMWISEVHATTLYEATEMVVKSGSGGWVAIQAIWRN